MFFALPRFEWRTTSEARFCGDRQWSVNQGRTVFSQLIAFLPDRDFRRCVARYDGDARLRGFSCWDQYLAMAFAQLTYRESLRDIEACLRALGTKLYHMGFDVNVLDDIVPEAGAFYVMDRGYIFFERLYVFTLSAASFVVRTKENVLLQRRYSHPVDKGTGVRSDHTVILTTIGSATAYPDALRRISYYDAESNHRLKFLTNNFTLPALRRGVKKFT